MIFRNSFMSLTSLAIPLLVGLVTVPHIINDLGLQRFGVLTLIWAVIGYASLFDLGISRALTKRVATLQGQIQRLRSLVRSGLCLMGLFGVVMGLLSLVITRQFDYQRFGLSQEEFDQSVLLLAVNIPLVIVSGGFRGVLEGMHRFSVVSAVRLGFGLITFIAPLFALASTPRIDYIIAIMLGARVIGTLVMVWSCRAYLPKGNVSHSRRKVELRNLLSFGGWVTVSNLASALMLYMDRFFLASSSFASSLAFYTTPYEFVTKLFILPSALSSVLFPYMAQSSKFNGVSNQLLVLGGATVLASVTPAVTLIILFAPELLGWWVSPEFASEAAPALRVLSIGVLVNCLAQIFQTYLLGHDQAALIAKMHIIELVIFLPLLYVSIQHFSIEGAAWTWTLRIIIDSIGMALILEKLKLPTGQHWWALTTSIMVPCLVFICADLGVYIKLLLLAALTTVSIVGGIWFVRHLLVNVNLSLRHLKR
ncbi:flippase [Pseudomonas protegens]|uniref:flippase n=1 Tax=Pseudomonas protegens TaxID=380021 RepID=UPI00384BDD8C